MIVGGIVLASVNMTLVRFIYLPALPFETLGQAEEVEVPLALLLLAFLLAGAFVAGTGTFVEHVRLRFLVRRNAKVCNALRAELASTRTALEETQAALNARTAEVAGEQARARRAEEAEAAAKALAEQERLRADETAQRLPPPAPL